MKIKPSTKDVLIFLADPADWLKHKQTELGFRNGDVGVTDGYFSQIKGNHCTPSYATLSKIVEKIHELEQIVDDS